MGASQLSACFSCFPQCQAPGKVAIAKDRNSFLFMLINWHTNKELLVNACVYADDKPQRPTVYVTSVFSVFADENSQLFYFRWSFSARAYPFRHPRLSRSGAAECSILRANVPNGADGVCTRLVPINVMELHAWSRCPRHATARCAFPPSSLLRGGIAPQ